jgi:NAD(P)-dependent dehydrogenase (short-subunit alcohol dehydrogenase family)
MAGKSKQVAVVTGANRGNGLEVAHQLARLGYSVLLGSSNLDKGRQAAATMEQEGLEVTAVQLDVTDSASVDALRELVELQYGKLDVLVNNAGTLYDSWEQATNADFQTVRKAFDLPTPSGPGAWRKPSFRFFERARTGETINLF